jgi:nucleobase:cation symporter-1, NCS1 family
MAVRALGQWTVSPPAFATGEGTAVFGWRSHFVLAASISVSLVAFVPGAYLVPALTLTEAVAAALIGSVLGAGLLAAVAAAAARRGMGTVGLLAATFGVPYGPAIAAFLFARHVLWTAFAIAFAANVAAHVPGLPGGRLAWGLAIGALALGLASLPPHVFVQRWLGWFAVWVGIVMIAVITLVSAFTYGIPVLHEANGLGGWPSFGQGIDLIAALPLLWLPVIGDYAMRSRSSGQAATGVFLGAGMMTAWFAIVGMLWVFTVNSRDVAGFMTVLPIAAGGIAVVVALEADAAAANLHSASMAAGRFGYRWFRLALVLAAVVAALVFVSADLFAVEDALLVLSMTFVPLFAVVLARMALPGAPRALAWIAWIAGVLVFSWINPGFWEPWTNSMNWLFASVLQLPFPLGGEFTPLPATVCSAVAAAGLYLGGTVVLRIAKRGA